MKKIDERIKKINKDHEELLKRVKASLLQNRDLVDDEINHLKEVLEKEDNNVKQYNAIIQAQNLIVSLTEEILACNSIDDIINIRKKLNYYINKIKTILAKRNVSESTITNYQEKVSSLRKDIAKYIRYLKRDNNLSMIQELHDKGDQMTLEELRTLKKAITKEIAYNKRNLVKNQEVKSLLPVPISFPNLTEKRIIEQPLRFDIWPEKREEIDPNAFSIKLPDEEVRTIGTHQLTIDDKIHFFERSAHKFTEQYHVIPTHDYQKAKVGRNIVTFFQNLPRYFHNKKLLKVIRKDYMIYYRGCDLVSYMEYIRQRNSIRHGLKCIFDQSYLSSEEVARLNSHEQCSIWLLNFCNERNLDLPVQYIKA